MRPARALLLAAVLLAAGCAGPSATRDEPSGAELVEPEPGIRIASDRGAIVGNVKDDGGLAVRGARVSLLTGDAFIETDHDGGFRFLNVTVGEHIVQAFSPGFVANETTILVAAGNVSRLTMHLLPDASRGAGYTPHLHDFWGGADSYTLMDGDQDFRDGALPEARYANTNDTPNNAFHRLRVKLPPSSPGHPSIILPGTKEIQVRLTWSSTASTLTKMGLRYSPPGVSPLTPQVTPVRESGATLRIPVTPELADSGHQLFTYWVFYLCPCNDPRNAPNYQPGVITGPIHIQLTLVRGNVELEPGHPDFWQGREELVLLPGEWKQVTHTNGNERTSSNCLTLAAPQLVPPGTTNARFELRWRYTHANNTALDRPYVLTWRTGDQDPGAATYDKYRRAAGQRGDHFVTYDVTVAPEQADSYYQKRTNWCWLPSPEGEENNEATTDVGRGLQVWLRIVASRQTR